MYEIADKARSWAEIDLSALRHNFEYASKRIGRKVICVLKADAYGNGAVECGLPRAKAIEYAAQPLLGSSKPAMILKVVVFPQPLGPRSVRNSFS